MKWWFSRPLHIQVIIGIVVGILLGIIFKEKIVVIKPIGDIFIRALMCLVVPLTLFTIVSGITSLKEGKNAGKVGIRITGYYLLTSLIATTIGVVVAILIKPGKGAENLLSIDNANVEPKSINFLEQIISWVPNNIFVAFTEANLLQVILFSIFVGIALISLGDSVKTVVTFFDEGTKVLIRLTEYVLYIAPFGIAAMVANMVGTLGVDMLKAALHFVIAQYVGLLIIVFLIYPILLKLFTKLKISRFYKNIASPMLVAASTTSSAATIPVSMKAAEEKLGVPKKIYGFTVPFGATVNMDGGAIAWGNVAIFASYLYGLPITFENVIIFVLLGTALSVGTAGVKGAAIVTSTVLLTTMGLPLTLVPILAAIWPLFEPGNTAVNITGDLVGTTIVASSMEELDEETFNKA